MTTWFVSDTHFGHKNVIRYCNRPYKNVWEMNAKLIDNWNEVVRQGDTVYHLGDFSFLPERQTKEVIECLNGNIIMIRGNHDRSPAFYHGITVIENDIMIDPNNSGRYWLAMSHYPDVVAKKSGLEVAMCGHIHEKWRSWKTTSGKIVYNVGVDVWNYKPIRFDDILDDLKNPINRITGEWKDPHEK